MLVSTLKEYGVIVMNLMRKVEAKIKNYYLLEFLCGLWSLTAPELKKSLADLWLKGCINVILIWEVLGEEGCH